MNLQSVQRIHSFQSHLHSMINTDYVLSLPKEYDSDQAKRWPFILFLHGGGERGHDLELVKSQGLPNILDHCQDFPFIVVSPQCSQHSWWSNDSLNTLLDEVISEYRVDIDRIYVTGLSMGGFGTWALAMAYPDRFAAIAPICGGGDPDRVCVLKHLPIWNFHGAKDTIVPLATSEMVVEALKKCGGNVRFTVYPDAGHDSWTETYNNSELYAWFLDHSRT